VEIVLRVPVLTTVTSIALSGSKIQYVSKWIHTFGKRFSLKIHQNTNQFLLLLTSTKVRIGLCFDEFLI